MSTRVTEQDVKQIIDTDVHCEPFIIAANSIVTAKLSTSGLSAEVLFEIERWLSAHFVAIKDPRPVSESIGGASVSFGSALGKGLEATMYGQQVKILDTTGTLATIGQRKARMHVYGDVSHDY